METVPKTCNWVKARAECSIDQIFLALREVADADAKERHALVSRPQELVSMQIATDTRFSVGRSWWSGGISTGEAVVFERTASGIAVKDGRTQRPMFMATPTLAQNGECKLRVDGHGELELWQVSRLALEHLFFEI